MNLSLNGHPARHEFADQQLAAAYFARMASVRSRLRAVARRHQQKEHARRMRAAMLPGVLIPMNWKAWWNRL